jgi:hypothetical protein
METRVANQAMTEAESRALFRDPTHAFRPSAYWFWHSIPDAQTSRAPDRYMDVGLHHP